MAEGLRICRFVVWDVGAIRTYPIIDPISVILHRKTFSWGLGDYRIQSVKVLSLGFGVQGLGFYLVAERDGVVRHISREDRRKLTKENESWSIRVWIEENGV